MVQNRVYFISKLGQYIPLLTIVLQETSPFPQPSTACQRQSSVTARWNETIAPYM